jgi:hypothetical protein
MSMPLTWENFAFYPSFSAADPKLKLRRVAYRFR